jgi:nucleotide-binding universal stress UspA family protein
MTTMHAATAPATASTSVLDRVLVGVDGSPQAREAARQAAALATSPVTLLAVYDLAPPLVGGVGVPVPAYDEADLRAVAEEALRRTRADVSATLAATCVRGVPWDELRREIDRQRATLVAVGSHGQGRARGILCGSTTTELVHNAPCSVLVARQAGPEFPAGIVVGVDGSPGSAAAYAAARELAERFGAELRPVVAHGGKAVDGNLVSRVIGHRHESSPDEPVRALVAAGADADLVVVGSRGLHGFASLGSVSERVAHRAGCSVLVVREAPWQAGRRPAGARA